MIGTTACPGLGSVTELKAAGSIPAERNSVAGG